MPFAEESPTHGGGAGADEGAGPSDSVRAAAKEQEAAAPATATDAGDAQPSVAVAATPAGERAAPEVDSRLESVMQQIDELKSSATTAGAVGADDSRSTMGSAPGEEGDASSQTTTGGSEPPSADGPLQGQEEGVRRRQAPLRVSQRPQQPMKRRPHRNRWWTVKKLNLPPSREKWAASFL